MKRKKKNLCSSRSIKCSYKSIRLKSPQTKGADNHFTNRKYKRPIKRSNRCSKSPHFKMLIITTDVYRFFFVSLGNDGKIFMARAGKAWWALSNTASQGMNWSNLVSHNVRWTQYFWKAIFFSFCSWIVLRYSFSFLWSQTYGFFFFVIFQMTFISRKCFSIYPIFFSNFLWIVHISF